MEKPTVKIHIHWLEGNECTRCGALVGELGDFKMLDDPSLALFKLRKCTECKMYFYSKKLLSEQPVSFPDGTNTIGGVS